MIDEAGAQARHLQVCPAARRIRRLRPEVGMKVLVVGLEQAQSQVTTQERQRVIQAAANGQCRTVGVGLMVRAAQPYETSVRVNERRDLRSRVAEDHTELSGRRSVIVPVGMIGIFDLSTHVAVEEVANTPDRAVIDRRVANGATDTDVGARGNRNRAVRGQVRVTKKNVDSRSWRLRRGYWL